MKSTFALHDIHGINLESSCCSLLLPLVHKNNTFGLPPKAMGAHPSLKRNRLTTTHLAAIKMKRPLFEFTFRAARIPDMETRHAPDASTIVLSDMESEDDLIASTVVASADANGTADIPCCPPNRKLAASEELQLERPKNHLGRYGPIVIQDSQAKDKATAPDTALPAPAPAPTPAGQAESRSQDGDPRTCNAEPKPQPAQHRGHAETPPAQDLEAEAAHSLVQMNLLPHQPTPKEPESHSTDHPQCEELVKEEPLDVENDDLDASQSNKSPLVVTDDEGHECDKDQVIYVAFDSIQRYRIDRDTWHRRYVTLRRDWTTSVKKDMYCLSRSPSEVIEVDADRE
jgi:hypothetical protein